MGEKREGAGEGSGGEAACGAAAERAIGSCVKFACMRAAVSLCAWCDQESSERAVVFRSRNASAPDVEVPSVADSALVWNCESARRRDRSSARNWTGAGEH